jgi:hypothetical protein
MTWFAILQDTICYNTSHLCKHGYCISVLKTRYPFIELNYNMGPNEVDGVLVVVKAVGKKQRNDKGRFGLTGDEAERLMEDGVADELEGLGWESPCDREDEDNEHGKTAPLVVNQSDLPRKLLQGRRGRQRTKLTTRRTVPRLAKIRAQMTLDKCYCQRYACPMDTSYFCQNRHTIDIQINHLIRKCHLPQCP